MTYRPEIDGLRAVAVIPVVLYHLNPALAPGGFVGVDVFFVISGFLITSIILRETGAGTFSLRNFWMRRLRRLFPALAAVLLATTAAGWFLLYDTEWQSLGAQLLAVLLLSANLHLHKETGDYWGPAAEDLPLLHTWSLAVEEQFYLFFPLLLLLLLRFGRRSLLPTLAVAAIMSLAWGIAKTTSDASAAFFLLPSRAWELLLGCLLACWNARSSGKAFKVPPAANALALLGLVAIVASCFVLRGDEGFPGYQALLPTLGATAVIAFSAGGRGLAKRLLSLPPLVFLGRISYSLYLWHWPIIVYWKLRTTTEVSAPQHAIPIVLASVAAATLSYLFVERPFRRPAYPIRSTKGAAIAISYTAVFALAGLLRGDHLQARSVPAFPTPRFTANDYSAGKNDAWKNGGVMLGTRTPDLVVIGSSHAMMYGSTLARIAQEQERSIAFLCVGNTFGRFHTEEDDAIYRDGMAEQRSEFDQSRRERLEYWKPGTVLWIGRWDNQHEILGAEAFDRIIRRNIELLLKDADRVVLFTQPPFSMERRGSLVRFADILQRSNRPVVGREDQERSALRTAANGAIRTIAGSFPRVGLVEVPDLFELPDGGVRILSAENRLLYHDFDHLSDGGAALLRPRIAEALTNP